MPLFGSRNEPRRPSGEYHGRLAFDGDTGFHIDPDGYPVVTDDGGRTWRYAVDGDPSHNERYELRKVSAIVQTTKEDPHHFGPLADDPNVDPEAPRATTLHPGAFDDEVTAIRPDNAPAIVVGPFTLVQDPDRVAASITSHTDAYASAPVDHPEVA